MRANEFITEEPRTAASKPEIVSVQDDGKTITIKVRGNDGAVRALSNSNPAVLQQQLNLKYGLRLPHSIAKKFAGMPAAMAEDQADNPDSWESQAADAERDEETAKMAAQDAKAGGLAEEAVDEDLSRRGFLKGAGVAAAAVAGAAGSAMAQSRPVDVSREFQNMRQDDPRVQHNKDIEEMTRAIYDQIVATRGQPIDRRQQQMWMTIAREKATEKLSKYTPGRSAPQSQSSGFPAQGSERRVSRNIDNFESQGVAEGAPISGDGGAVDNFRQQMANNTEIAYQKGMAEAKKKKKKKSSRSLGRYFFPGYGYYGSGESGEGGGDGGGGESKNRGMAEGSEDPFGPQGRFVGDTGPAQLTTTVPRVKLKIGDRVIYKPTEQRATIVGLSRDGTQARIDMPSPMGGRVFNCKVSDLKALGQGLIREKSTSQAQFRTMAAAAHDPEFARKVGIKQSVAREFNRADTGQSYKSLPKKS